LVRQTPVTMNRQACNSAYCSCFISFIWFSLSQSVFRTARITLSLWTLSLGVNFLCIIHGMCVVMQWQFFTVPVVPIGGYTCEIIDLDSSETAIVPGCRPSLSPSLSVFLKRWRSHIRGSQTVTQIALLSSLATVCMEFQNATIIVFRPSN